MAKPFPLSSALILPNVCSGSAWDGSIFRAPVQALWHGTSTTSASTNYQNVLISRRFRVFRTVVHRQPFRLGQQNVIVKIGVDVWRNVLGRSP